MIKVIAPAHITPCTIQLPPSKSTANRMLILAALCGKQPHEVLGRPLGELCDDIRALAELITQSCKDASTSNVEGTRETFVGAAGTAMRFGTAYLAVTPGRHVITGTIRLQQRPIGLLAEALRQLGANIQYMGKEGFPPLCITGNTSMRGGTITLKGNISSQFISALLMIAPTLKGGLTLRLEGEIVSRPYIDLTIDLMRRFGAQVEWSSTNDIHVEATPLTAPTNIDIEADWTAASYWYEIAALGHSNAVAFQSGLDTASMQGDKVVHDIFESLSNTTPSRGICKELSFAHCPDLAQTIVVTCCMLSQPFHFTGLQTLRIKETDRIMALQTELGKLGYVLQTTDSTISWDGRQCVPQSEAVIETYHDHRMAMAFAPCAITLGSINIADPDVVTKSYPTFWQDLKTAGFILERY